MILGYLNKLVNKRLYETGLMYHQSAFANWCKNNKKVDYELHNRIIKAICVELSVPNRVSAIEDMIVNMPLGELKYFETRELWN